MSRRLVLVKHGLPEIEEGVPSADWRLSAAGREACMALARKLTGFRFEAIVASSEAKAADSARAMAEVLNVPVSIDPDLVEHQRRTAGYLGRDDFETAIAALFDRPDELMFGDETANAALARFTAGIDRLPATGDVLVVAHGTVATLYLRHVAGIDALPFWKALGLSNAAVLVGGTVTIVRPDEPKVAS